MKILVIATVPPGTPMDELTPHLEGEERLSWQYYKDDVLREFYARDPEVDELGAIFVFEADTVEAVKTLVADYPLAKAGLIDFAFHPLPPFTNFELLFKSQEETNQ